MEELTLMMMSCSGSPDTSMNESINPHEPISTTTTCPTWKLYENPFYNPQLHNCQANKNKDHHHHLLHHLQLSPSDRNIAASFWDLTFFMEADQLDIARAQIIELEAELEFERKARKKVENMNKRLAKELEEERRGREALERVCEELAKEISAEKTEVDRMKREMEEERKMLRMAEVLREERVQMKLAEAKILFEEKLLELMEGTNVDNNDTSHEKQKELEDPDSKIEQRNQEDYKASRSAATAAAAIFSGKFIRLNLSEKSCDHDDNNSCIADNVGPKESSTRVVVFSEKPLSSTSSASLLSYNNGTNISSFSTMAIQKRASTEAENPHIKRGIKGFVEFPRVVRAIESKSSISRHWGTKLECQKAQLKILLKQKSPIRSNNLITS